MEGVVVGRHHEGADALAHPAKRFEAVFKLPDIGLGTDNLQIRVGVHPLDALDQPGRRCLLPSLQIGQAVIGDLVPGCAADLVDLLVAEPLGDGQARFRPAHGAAGPAPLGIADQLAIHHLVGEQAAVPAADEDRAAR